MLIPVPGNGSDDGLVQIAALSGRDSLTGTEIVILDPDPLVRRAQELLTRLGRYAGPVDGQFNQQLAEALTTVVGGPVDRKEGFGPDPLLTRDVVDRLALMVDVNLMQERLRGATERQKEAARQALDGSRAAQDLLDRAVFVPMESDRDPDSCFADPGTRCVLTEALAAADVVLDRKQRDWAYSEILVAQAEAGYLGNALATTRRLSDPRSVLVGMRKIAGALARASSGTLASETAAAIPDLQQQAAAYLDIAEANLEIGELQAARKAADAALLAVSPNGKPSPDDILRAAAVSARLGDEESFREMLESYRQTLPSETGAREAAELALVERLANLDRVDEAERVFAPFAVRKQDQVSARIALAMAQARRGNGDGALVTLGGVKQLRYKSVGLSRLASTLHEDPVRAVPIADLSMLVAGRIQLSYARAYAFARLVDTWILLGNTDVAETALDQIDDDRLRAVAALRLVSSGSEDTRQGELLAMARRSIDGVADRLARVWLLCSLEAEFGSKTDVFGPGFSFRSEAIDLARSIRDPWFRARAWARISEIFVRQSVPPGPSR